ncbi:MAG: response regulator [Pseudomonadota bacterium]
MTGSESILVVEDDPFLSLHMEAILQEAGFEAVDVVHSVEDAMEAVERVPVALAILDVNLRGDYVFPVAERLKAREIPFTFVSAYANDTAIFPEHLRGAPRHVKPVNEHALVETVRSLLS